MNFKSIIIALLAISTFSACTDVIDIELEEGQTQLVVDAFINDLPEAQVIRLRNTAPYFSNAFAPEVTGATVVVTDDMGEMFEFKDDNNNGNYTWTPGAGEGFGEIGRTYFLSITLGSDGKNYLSQTTMNPVPPIDSITVEFRESELGQPEGHYAELRATDLPGEGNCYWIKTYKNGLFLNKPQEINLAFDASFTQGGNVDGVPFIQPIAEAINRIPDSGDGATDTSDLPPYAIGDTVRVELHAIAIETFYFLDEVRTQTTLGDATIFAEPPANVPSNIVDADEEDSPQGFFSVAAVSVLEKIVE